MAFKAFDICIPFLTSGQMLELQNEELARHWLSLKPNISAAICFDESDHLTCVVYLDDAHTRGTDLKLPRETRATVNLGPKVTKDRLLQGCMRMRQLVKGQSVVFFAPGEVDRRIRGLIPRGQDSWVQRESRTLEEMYEPVSKTQVAGLSPEISSIPSLRELLERLGVSQLIDVRMAEEQEREVNHEVELERHVQPPPRVYTIPLFFQTGIDKPLDSTAEWSPSPLATTDFAITTMDSSITDLSDYLRPVLSSGTGRDSIAVVISPHEANELLPVIRKSRKVRLHVYTPRVTASMRSFSDLAFYTIPESSAGGWTAPAHLRIELDLFAGQLYFDSREQYQLVCVLFWLHMTHPGAKHVEVDGFVPPAYRMGESSPFSVSVIPMFKELTGLRRKGMGFGGTDLGRVLDGRLLSSEFESWVKKECGPEVSQIQVDSVLS
ncbi:hypothetical protein BJY52DRAFT_1211758 [Lactarius psammicola]|nr:hypothetical protein BJY52DRAFT_1211758 [Lactarius psammicola]